MLLSLAPFSVLWAPGIVAAMSESTSPVQSSGFAVTPAVQRISLALNNWFIPCHDGITPMIITHHSCIIFFFITQLSIGPRHGINQLFNASEIRCK